MATTTRKLVRLPDQGQIAGVCAGLAQYFDIDVVLLRVAFVLLAIATGGGFVVAYLIMAVVMPSNKDVKKDAGAKGLEHNAQTLAAEMRDTDRGNRLRNYFGFGLIALGAWLLLESLFPGWFDFRWDYIWPIALIIIGLFIATRRNA